jgi:hypothetical protein
MSNGTAQATAAALARGSEQVYFSLPRGADERDRIRVGRFFVLVPRRLERASLLVSSVG